MHEDKLTPDQRIRLEAVAQANLCRQTAGPVRPLLPGVKHDPVGWLLDDADRIERYIRDGDGVRIV